VIWQLRTYAIRPGHMDDFRALWRDYVVPARQSMGFVVQGGWFDPDGSVFVWLVGHEAPEGWEAAERHYYDNAPRERFPHDPREFVAEVQTMLLRQA
jgi:NIPSNAP